MESFFLLIPLAVLFTVMITHAFFWAVNHRQFDDLDNASSRVLFDDDLPPAERSSSRESSDD